MSNSLVIGLICPNQSDQARAHKDDCTRFLKEIIDHDYEFSFKPIDLHDLLRPPSPSLSSTSKLEKSVRTLTKLNEIFALGSIKLIRDHTALSKTNNIFVLKFLSQHEEIELLRSYFGQSFFLIGLINSASSTSTPSDRLWTKSFFFQSDVFVNMRLPSANGELKRFLDLTFGSPYVTPTPNEQNMFLAYSSSLRSSSLSRQVGAVVVSERGDVVSAACNEVPKYGGGQYWPDERADGRQFKRYKRDSNRSAIDQITLEVLRTFSSDLNAKTDEEVIEEGRRKLAGSSLFNLTEYFREIHAETEAILSCARNGVSTCNSTLYSTTFPCHYCTKHIVSAGVKKVYFVEPYPKSKIELYSDSIRVEPDANEADKVVYEQFEGVGPRRYFDLFSLSLGTGYAVKRKNESGEVVDWASVRPKRARVPRVNFNILEFDDWVRVRFKEFKNANVDLLVLSGRGETNGKATNGNGARRSKTNGHDGGEDESDSEDELLFVLSKETKSFLRELQIFLCNN